MKSHWKALLSITLLLLATESLAKKKTRHKSAGTTKNESAVKMEPADEGTSESAGTNKTDSTVQNKIESILTNPIGSILNGGGTTGTNQTGPAIPKIGSIMNKLGSILTNGIGQIGAGQTAPTEAGQTAPTEAGQIAPNVNGSVGTNQTGPEETTETGQTAPTGEGQTSPIGAGQTAPTEAGQTAPTEAGQTAPIGAGQTAPTETGQTAPTGAGQTAPTGAGQTAPTEAGQTAPIGPGQTAPTETGQTAPNVTGPVGTNQTGSEETNAPGTVITSKPPTESVSANKNNTAWGYGESGKGFYGPGDWSQVSAKCKGSNQSPIDIFPHATLYKAPWKPMLLESDNNLGLVTGVLSNTGRDVQFTVNEKDGTAFLSGGPADSAHYRLSRIQFHIGCMDGSGSEHTINSKPASAEMQMVFYNKKYKNINEALSQSDGIAIISSLFDYYGGETYYHNPTLERLVSFLPNITRPGSSLKLDYDDRIELTSLVPDLTRDNPPYYTYHGSLTTPPCYESVTWIVLKTRLTISIQQLGQFRQLQSRDGSQLCDNFRLVQPSNNREITKNYVQEY